jgi:hypothetical protein
MSAWTDEKGRAMYRDGGRDYLELHALRAPLARDGAYREGFTDDDYNWGVECAIHDFEVAHRVEIFTLGRSGRHICIEDTPTNRRRQASLSRKAIAAARECWAGMREPAEV